MKRFVLLHRGGDPPPRDLDCLDAIEGLRVLDHELSRAVLVEASEEAIDRARALLAHWIISEQVEHDPPSPAPPVRSRPKAG